MRAGMLIVQSWDRISFLQICTVHNGKRKSSILGQHIQIWPAKSHHCRQKYKLPPLLKIVNRIAYARYQERLSQLQCFQLQALNSEAQKAVLVSSAYAGAAHFVCVGSITSF